MATLNFKKGSAWLRAIQNRLNFAGLPRGVVAMATESSHRLIVEKWLNCIFSISSEVM